jgi:hypothetical protein
MFGISRKYSVPVSQFARGFRRSKLSSISRAGRPEKTRATKEEFRRGVRLIGESRKKDDRLDARTLARLARIDPQLLCPVKHRSAQAQATLVRRRTGSSKQCKVKSHGLAQEITCFPWLQSPEIKLAFAAA